MSFDLYIFDRADPPTDLDALRRVTDVPDAPLTPRLVALVDELGQRYPSMTLDPAASPWASEPFAESVAGGTGIGLNIVWPESDRMSAEVPPLAAARGLAVYDPKSAPARIDIRQPSDRIPRCALCFREPASALPIARQESMIIIRRTTRVQAPLCREHGISTTKLFIGKTLLLGWWGVISAFTNVGVLFSDLRTLNTYRRLAPPEPRPTAPLGSPLTAPPGTWETDPFGRYQHRWLRSDGWTDLVSFNGFVSHDPPGWR